MTAARPSWRPATTDLFCRVVDNFGDAGVCWRLARRLALGHGQRVRLFIDQPDTLASFVRPDSPDQALLAARQIRVLAWDAPGRQEALAEPADLVIETFGCDIPADYASVLAAREPAAQWYNLEYLSAEEWVDGCHALPSPHPRLPIQRIFFFPGFSPASGGLLREPGLLARRLDWQDRQRRAGSAADAAALTIGLFCYRDAPLAALLDGLACHTGLVHCRLFQGPAQALAQAWADQHPGHRLRLEFLPWLTQDGFDEVLWSCDLNLVRGEDSFVRAQWAGRPLLWDIYPQSGDAHLVKMAAFLRRYRDGLDGAAAAALGALWQPWVRREADAVAAGWQAVAEHLPTLTRHAEAWCAQLAARPDLADALMAHVQQRSDAG